MKSLLLMLCALPLCAFEVVIDKPSPAAEKDFQYHMKKMTGAEVPLKVAEHDFKVKGHSEVKEAFRIRVKDNKVYISGESPLAVSHGLYEVLAKLGCDWVIPGPRGEVIPKVKNPSLPDLDEEQKPSFDMRNPWYGGSPGKMVQLRKDHVLWKTRHKLQNDRELHPLYMHGGHVWGAVIRQFKKEFQAHPEYLALVRQADGSMKRTGPQLETTNPKVLDIFEQYIRSQYKKYKWSKDRPVCIGVGPSDGGGYSESAETKLANTGRIDPMTGNTDMTDIMFLLCNQLMDRLEKEFPNLYLGFYLYSNHADYPVRYKNHPKVIIVIADISYSRMHSTLEPVPTRRYFRSIMEKWANTPNVKFFRGYNYNLAECFLPFSKLKMWADDLPMYHRMNVRGVYNESAAANATLAPSNYLEAVLLWNVGADPDQVLRKFCRNAYGKAADKMYQFWTMLTRRQSEAKEEAGSFHSFMLIYDLKFVAAAQKLFDEASKLAETDDQKYLIANARFPVDQLGEFLTMRNQMCKFKFADAQKTFSEMMNKRQNMVDKRDGMVSYGAIRMMDRFFREPLENLTRYSVAPYKIVFPLPDEMITVFDPYNKGAAIGFADPELGDKNYLRTKTYSTTWASQGLIGIRNGSSWYRVRFPAMKGPAGLIIGGADSIARVYCNGKYVGEGRGFARSMTFDLTDFLNKGDRENFLAIQVERPGNSEVGTGGLIYQSYIFTGPRLKQQAPANREEYRLLPGGAIEKVQK